MMGGRKDEKRDADRATRSRGGSAEESKQAEQRSKDRTTEQARERGVSTDKSTDKPTDKPTDRSRCKETDFLSAEFDAERVLQTPENALELPVPNAKIFNNLDEYALKSFPSKRPVASSTARAIEPTDLDILRRQHEIKERMRSQIEVLDSKQAKARARQVKNVLSLMESDESGLRKFLNSRLRIFVRRRRKSKHPCERYACLFGQLMFFDKHWNLILSDVSETMQFVSQSPADCEAATVDAGSTETTSAVCGGKQVATSPVDDESRSNSKLCSRKTTGLSTSLISSIDNRRLVIGRNETEAPVRISIRERHFTRLFIRGDNIIYISKV